MTYFLDTNVIIDLLNGHSSVLAAFKNAYTFESVKIPDLKVFSIGAADNKKSSAQIKQPEESIVPHLYQYSPNTGPVLLPPLESG